MNELKQKDSEKTAGRLKSARRAVLIVLIICIIGFSVIYRKEFTIDSIRRLASYIDFSSSDQTMTDDVTIEYGAAGNICTAYKGRVAVLSRDYLKLYDNLGNEEASIETGYGEPAMESTGKYLLTYSRGGTKLNVVNGKNEIFSRNFDYPIISASLNDNGYMGVVTGAQGYKAMVTVFDSSFNELYRCYSYENYILDVAISPDNENMAVILLNSKDGVLVSTVAMYNLRKEKPTAEKSYSDLALYKVKYSGPNELIAIGDKMALFLNKDGGEKSRFDYKSAKVASYSTDSREYAALALDGYSTESRSTVVILDENGEAKAQIPVNNEIKDVYMSGNLAMVLEQGACRVYTKDGELKKSVELSGDARKIIPLSSSELMFIGPASVKITRTR